MKSVTPDGAATMFLSSLTDNEISWPSFMFCLVCYNIVYLSAGAV